jgi:hypothetical protein
VKSLGCLDGFLKDGHHVLVVCERGGPGVPV